jgi:protein tyrosine/serine phosphatase
MTKSLVAMLFFWGASYAPCQAPASSIASDSVGAASAVPLKHFAKVDEGVYKGSRPKGDAQYEYLQSLGVKYIVDLQLLPFMSKFEERKARKYGITVIHAIMNASPISPSEKHVDHILAILRDPSKHPIYFHCKLGRDRTNVIAALYKMYFMGMSEQEAMQYLHDSGYGFKFNFLRSGLTRYVKKHPTPPADLASASASATATKPRAEP